tara:strand:- start:3051 stop:5120 length:2070 start_codon:yes stop_codon:yes gene_type:complete
MKKRVAAMFGIKLLPVSGRMVSTAKNMLDTEMEYISYLRNRKKMFFMTQVQQTRVTVVSKKRKEAEKKVKQKSKSGLTIPKKFLQKKGKDTLKQRMKRVKGRNPIVKLKRKMKAGGLKVGRKVNRVLKIDKAKKFMSRQGQRLGSQIKNVGKKIGGKVLQTGKSAVSAVKNKGASLVNRVIPKSAKKKVVQKLVKTGAKKGLQKAGAKVATKMAAKTAVKIGLKKIPVIGLVAGLGFGLQRLMKGDITGALMEAGSGIASTIPGPGTAISAGIDAALIGKDVTGMKDGGEVTSPTRALIAEGGEPELVVPHSKLGPVFRNLLSKVGNILTDVTTGFLSTLPVPTGESSRILGETAKIAAVFGQKGKPVSVFKGGKIAKMASGFLKRVGGGAMGLAKSAFKMTPMGLAASMFDRPAKAETFRKRKVINKISTVNGVTTSESWDSDSATSYGNFPITDTYGSTEGRQKPHGGVDIGTPVGTPVGFTEGGKILAAGKFGGYGNMMDVWLPQTKIQMRIAHLSKFIKRTGEFIAGEKLAETGGEVGDPGAGSSTGPHLHFEADNKKDSTRYGGAGNPMPYAPLLSFTAVEPPSGEGAKGGPSLGASYGHPLQYTVRWPTSNGAMGGPGLLGAVGGMFGNMFGGGGKPQKPQMIPYPVPVAKPIPIPVTKVVTVEAKTMDAYGVDSFSGRYVKL